MPDRIVELDGVQHHFPGDATDAEIAKALHSQSRSDVHPVAANEPDTRWGGIVKSLKDQFAQAVGPDTSKQDPFVEHHAPPAVEKMMGTPLAHPTGLDTIDGFTSPAGLLTLASGAASGMAESPAARRSVGSTLRFIGENTDLTKPLKMVGKAGELLERSGQEPPTAAPPPTGPHMDLSRPIQPGGLTQQQILERVRAVQAAGGTSIPPTQAKGPLGGQLRMATPEAPTQQPGVTTTAASPMQQPRVQVGAEVVGRQNGLTKDVVRQQTGPLLGEAQGAASPVVPQTPFERMHDKLKAMGPGNPEREAYVQAAGDPKTAGQLEIMRRTLERNGLSVAAATSMAEAIRRRVMARLSGGQKDQ